MAIAIAIAIAIAMLIAMAVALVMALNRNLVKSATGMRGTGAQIGENTPFSISLRHQMYALACAVRVLGCHKHNIL